MRVCVIGGGQAGVEAAREAIRSGAEVTLIDPIGVQGRDWQSWPDLVQPSAGSSPAVRPLPSEVEVVRETRVVFISKESAATARGPTYTADAFVIADRPDFEPMPLEGRAKPGVATMDAPERYQDFSRALSTAERVVVAGEGGRGMQIAERAAGGRSVTVLVSSWQHEPPTPAAVQVLSEAAQGRGVSVGHGRVERALGRQKLEAVLASGTVMPADALAAVPRRIPHRIPGPFPRGRRGGVLVGRDLKSGCPGVFAAGGAAEVCAGSLCSATLEDEERPSGRIAGANAGGSDLKIPPTRGWSLRVFGLTLARVGLGVGAARRAGFDAASVGGRCGDRASSVIVYDQKTGMALGLEVVCETGAGEVPLPQLGRHTTLKSLAYDGGSGSTDISMVSETARLGF